MTTKVTKESLAEKIRVLEEVKGHYGFMSIEQEYQLKAYRMLLDYLREEEHAQQMRADFEQGRL